MAMSAAQAQDLFTGTAPTVIFSTATETDPNFAAYETALRNAMNSQVSEAFDSTIAQANRSLAGFKGPDELAKGFGNANAYSMHSATLQGFQNYSLFAVASGLMIGVQAPSTSLNYYSKVGDEITQKGDIYAGLGMGFSYLNVGVNAGFLFPGLYVNAKYGAFEREMDDFSLDFSVMGVGVNYRLLDSKSLIGLVKWRGISIGSGFYMQSSKINMKVKPDSLTTQAPLREAFLGNSTGADSLNKEALLTTMGYGVGTADPDVILSPVFNMGIDVSTMTIPFDAATAVSVFWGLFNVTAGAGFDLNFGSSEIVLKGASSAKVESDPDKVTFTPANITVNGSGESAPSFGRLRLMTGLGLGLGPVKLDIPLVYYFNSGMAFGITGAIVW